MSLPLPDINRRLLRGDKVRIANALNCHRQMVYKVLAGDIGKRQTALTLQIIQKAVEIGHSNEKLNVLTQPQSNEA